jgi:hypothetical protein
VRLLAIGGLGLAGLGAFGVLMFGQQAPTFRGGVSFVRVDVGVTAKSGAFVGDLSQQDFEISEQGAPQKIDAFKLVSLDGGLMGPPASSYAPIRDDAAERREVAREGPRHQRSSEAIGHDGSCPQGLLGRGAALTPEAPRATVRRSRTRLTRGVTS